MSVLDHWNPEIGSPGDDLSAKAEDKARERLPTYSETNEPRFDYSPRYEMGPDIQKEEEDGFV